VLQERRTGNRIAGRIVVTAAYGVALAVAFAVVATLRASTGMAEGIALALAADVAATVAIFLFSLALSNSSLYDPYWSLAPLPIAVYWLRSAGEAGSSLRGNVAVTLLAIWGLRLTWNWMRRWRGLRDEDWRYVALRNRCGPLYWPVSFLGIHLLPTLLVFAGCLPLYVVSTSTRQPRILDGIALLVTAGAIWIEARADTELRRFLDTGPHPIRLLTTGLRSRLRYPNYLGEIGFWWGLWLFGAAAAPRRWWTIAGPLSITLLFVLVSIPMMDRRMLRRPGYADRMRTTPALVPRLRANPGG